MKHHNPPAAYAFWSLSLFTKLLSCVCLVVSSLSAQTPAQTGTIVGRISNLATSEFLQGASVQIEGTSYRTTAEPGGEYVITAPVGSQVLVVSFTGLDTARVPVLVNANQTITQDIAMKSDVYIMEPFAVKGEREGKALALQLQKESTNAKMVVAADTYGSPAANPGELIQRLPGISTEIIGGEVRTINVRGMGPAFSSLMIDGEQMASSAGSSFTRDYQIEQLGTANIETVELIKAPKPEDDANAVAGFINLVSKRGFDSKGRQMSLTAGTMWRKRGFKGSPYQDHADNLDLIRFSFSDAFSVFGGSNNLGIALNLSRRVSSTTQDEIGPRGVFYTSFSQSYLNPASANPLTRLFGTGDFGCPAIAQTFGLNLDYKFSPDSFAYFKFTFNSNDQYQMYNRVAVGDPSATSTHFTSDSTYEHSIMKAHTQSNPSVRNETATMDKRSANNSFMLGSEHKFFHRTGTLSLKANYSHANINYPAYNRIESDITGVGFELDRRGQNGWYPIFRQTEGPSIYDANNYLMKSYVRQNNRAPNDIAGGRIDYKQVLPVAIPLYIKTGVKYTKSSREANTDYSIMSHLGADGKAMTADDTIAPYVAYQYKQGDGRYGPFPFVQRPSTGKKGDPLSAPSGYWTQTVSDVYNSYVNSNTNDLRFTEKIASAYMQIGATVGRLQILGGMRMERTKVTSNVWSRNATAANEGNYLSSADAAENLRRAKNSFVRRVTEESGYRKYHPGLHFVYRASHNTTLRASYNNSVSRPPSAAIASTISENPDAETVTIGNPALKPYTSNNFEFSVEQYFEPAGVFSIGVFDKQIHDYYRTFTQVIPPEGVDGNGLYAGYTASRSQNIGKARIKGFEVNYHQQFRFLPGFWRGFGFNANFTTLSARGDFGTVSTTTKLGNMAPRTGNAGLSYRGHGWDITFLGNWTDMKYVGTSGVEFYNQARLLFDLKMQYTINRRFMTYLDIVNLTDEPVRTEVSYNKLLRNFKTDQGVSFAAGIRTRF